jgi:hypothetical protein
MRRMAIDEWTKMTASMTDLNSRSTRRRSFRLTLLSPLVASDGSSGVSTLGTLLLLLVHGPSSTSPTQSVGLGVGLSERGRTLLVVNGEHEQVPRR